MSGYPAVLAVLLVPFLVFLAGSAGADPGQGPALGDWPLLLAGQDGWGSEGWGEEPEEEPSEPEPEPWKETRPEPVATPGGGAPSGPAARLSLSVYGLGAMPMSGDAGAGMEAPAWSDAYGTGMGVGAAGEFRALPALGLRIGLYYQSLTAQEFSAMGAQNQLSDFTYIGFSLGGRFYFLLDRPSDRWFGAFDQVFKGAALFLGFDFGVGMASAVTWDLPAPSWEYWEAGMILVPEFVAGFEYRFSPSVGLTFELGYGTNTAPKAAGGDATPLNEAGSLTALRFRIGLLFAF